MHFAYLHTLHISIATVHITACSIYNNPPPHPLLPLPLRWTHHSNQHPSCWRYQEQSSASWRPSTQPQTHSYTEDQKCRDLMSLYSLWGRSLVLTIMSFLCVLFLYLHSLLCAVLFQLCSQFMFAVLIQLYLQFWFNYVLSPSHIDGEER